MSAKLINGSTAARAPDNLLKDSLRPLRKVLWQLILFSMIANLAALAMSLYMMQIYDRVLTSQSRDTLSFLTIAIMLAMILAGVLEGIRQKVTNRVGTWLAQKLAPSLLIRSLEQRLTASSTRLEALRELSQIKNFISTPTVFSVIDMLWVPLYLVIIFLLHPVFGVISSIGVVVLLGLTLFNERGTRTAIKETQTQTVKNLQYAECLVRNSEVIDAMGMSRDTVAHWAERYFAETETVDKTQIFSSNILAMTKFARNAIQVALLGFGALLVLDQQLTGGAMIAGSIIAARLLAPIEAAMSYWKQFVLARHSYQKLLNFFELPRARPAGIALPTPTGRLSVEALTYAVPGMKSPILKNITFEIKAGTSLAIVGPSASGKTTLSRLLVGVLKPNMGHVRLDGADTFDWMREDFGPHVGYLPQDIELLPGTIRQNISRFNPNATDADIIAAAKLADCHDMILQLGDGYDCLLTEGGHQLSGGQRQRIGLARALFGMPKLIVLDEPNSSLDSRGDVALAATIQKLKALGITNVTVSHRANLLRLADKILMMVDGRVANFDDAEKIIAQLSGGKLASPQHRAQPQNEAARQKPAMFNQEGMSA
jgi:PrtD family type I secretion system ABC transporter